MPKKQTSTFTLMPPPSAIVGRVDHALYGIVLVLIAHLLFSMVDTSVKWLVTFGYSALMLTFMRYVGHFIISLGSSLKANRRRDLFGTQHTVLLMVRGSLLMFATIGNFIALKYISLTLTSTIFFSAPIIICLLSGIVLGEKVSRLSWIAIALGFAGVLIAIRPFSTTFHWAALISLAGVASLALYLLMTRHFAGVVAPHALQFHAGLIGTVTSLPFAIYYWQWPESTLHWVLIIGLGLFAWGGHEILTRAYRYASASLLAPYTYSFMIYLTLWSILIFNHYPDTWTLAGAALIVISGLLIWLTEKSRKRTKIPLPEPE